MASPLRSSSRQLSGGMPSIPPSRWDSPVPRQNTRPSASIPYRPGLAPIPSPLRPHCLARDRLRIWRPTCARNTLDSQGRPVNLLPADLARIADVLEHAFADSTRETYGTGLLLFHIFCDKKDIQDSQWAPACPALLSAFVSVLTGSYASKTIASYLHGVRAWHIIHGASWHPDTVETDAIIKAAISLCPPTSKRKACRPYTVDYMLALQGQLDVSSPLGAAIFTCLTTTFYTAARLGEFTLPNLKPESFDKSTHVMPANVSSVHDHSNLEMTAFHLPRTKSSPTGEDVSWAKQHGLTDPDTAFANHLLVNAPPAHGLLFAYRHGKGHCSLTKAKMLATLAKAARALCLDPLQGHGIRIGSTLEYLLRGVPFDVMKAKGRWASDAFLLYLRKHAQIMAPYMQAAPALHDSFVRFTMPPVR
jgi:hypothetical protein